MHSCIFFSSETDVKKYLCLLYYKIRADRSNTLNIDYDKGAKEYFKEEFGEALKDIKETLLWVSVFVLFSCVFFKFPLLNLKYDKSLGLYVPTLL